MRRKIFSEPAAVDPPRKRDAGKGTYSCHNQVGHNRLDVGNFVVFSEGLPVFIDAGVGRYTARTFIG